jgi:hypothetical protein
MQTTGQLPSQISQLRHQQKTTHIRNEIKLNPPQAPKRLDVFLQSLSIPTAHRTRQQKTNQKKSAAASRISTKERIQP